LVWNANTDSVTTGYKIYYGTASGNYGIPINVGNVTTFTLTGLTQGQTYFLAATAYSASGLESGFSNEVSGTAKDVEVVGTPGVLSGPTNGTTGTSYTYTTGASSSNLGDPVQYQFDWKGDASDLSSWGSASQSKTWTSAGTYSVRARARCATHTTVTSNWSSSLSVSISAAAPSSWLFCANENQQCSFTGTKNVRYGANGVYVYKSLTGGTMCTNTVFGDPTPGVVKQCYIQ